MNRTKASFAFLLILSLCFSAHAESTVASLIDAAEKLAFETDNVTITGKAEFLLDGKRFKTAEITYVQDGENSFWQEKLLTPEDWRPDRESGFTVVQYVDEIIGDEIFVTETLHPGLYRHGYSNAEKTLIRRSPITDLLLAMSRSAAVQLEPLREEEPVSRFQRPQQQGGNRQQQRPRNNNGQNNNQQRQNNGNNNQQRRFDGNPNNRNNNNNRPRNNNNNNNNNNGGNNGNGQQQRPHKNPPKRPMPPPDKQVKHPLPPPEA